MSKRKLTDEQEREIRRHYFALDWSLERVCQHFGISETYVERICGGRKTSEATRAPIERIYN